MSALIGASNRILICRAHLEVRTLAGLSSWSGMPSTNVVHISKNNGSSRLGNGQHYRGRYSVVD